MGDMVLLTALLQLKDGDHFIWNDFTLIPIFQDKIQKSEDFVQKLNQICGEYRKARKLDEEEFHAFFPIKLARSHGFIFTVGSFAYCKTYTAFPVGSVYRIEKLPSGVDYYQMDEDTYPMSGFIDGASLVVSGRLNHYSNYGSSYVARYEKRRGVWKLVQFQHGGFEGDWSPFTQRGHSWIAEVSGRTYPLNMSTSHSDARVWMKRDYVFRDGKLQPSQDEIISSPMNTLDNLLDERYRNDLDHIRQRTTSLQVAKTFRQVAGRLGRNEDWLIGNHGSDDSTIYAAKPRLTFKFKELQGKWLLAKIVKSIPKEFERL